MERNRFDKKLKILLAVVTSGKSHYQIKQVLHFGQGCRSPSATERHCLEKYSKYIRVYEIITL